MIEFKMNRRLIHLDMMRGVAALLVCLWHLRCFGLANFKDLKFKPYGTGAAYFFSGLGHQSVVIFFVLSGFFIGGSVVSVWRRNCWSWRMYGIHRLTRLWVVLIPALGLTLLWDTLGQHLKGGQGYDGRWFALCPSGPSPDHPVSLSLKTFLGNCFFLQTITVPVFGTNGPLWSLANEFWYYVIFPFLWIGLFAKGLKRCLPLIIAGVIIWLVPHNMLPGFCIWLFGVISYLAWKASSSNYRYAFFCNPLFLIVAGFFFVGTLIAARCQYRFGSDYWVGGTFALLVPGLAEIKWNNKWYEWFANHLSDISYTLYVTHFSFLAFIFFIFLSPMKFQMNLSGLAILGGCLVATLIYAKLIWWCFERNTGTVRKTVESRLMV